MQLIKAHSAYGLPSFEPASNEAELYLKFANARKNEQTNTNKMRYVVQASPYSVSPASSSCSLPVLRSNNVVISSENIIDFLQLNFLDLDEVHNEAKIEITALRKYLTSRLGLAHSYFEWNHFSSNEFAKDADTLTRLMLKTTRQNQISKALSAANITTPEDALKVAAETFQLLATKLEGKRFYFGSNAKDITSLDTASAAYVAVCLNANAASSSDFHFLPTLLKIAFPSLVEHSHRVFDASGLEEYTITPDYSLYARAHKKNLLECIKNNLPLPSFDSTDVSATNSSISTSHPTSSSIDDIDDETPSTIPQVSEVSHAVSDDDDTTMEVKFGYSQHAAIAVMKEYREFVRDNSLLSRMDRDEASGKNPLWQVFTPLALLSMASLVAFAKLRK